MASARSGRSRRAFACAILVACSRAAPRPGRARRRRASSCWRLAADRRGDGVPTLALRFPRDFGAHPRVAHRMVVRHRRARRPAARTWGFQITFFRAATGIAGADASAFRGAPAAVRPCRGHRPAERRLRHDQRHRAQRLRHRRGRGRDTALVLRDWRLDAQRPARTRSRYRAARRAATAPASLSTSSSPRRQPVLLQGERGVSRKGPRRRARRAATTASRSSPCAARSRSTASRSRVAGRAWLDHEWSDAYLDAGRGRLGLDRHEPRRRRRADGVSHAPPPTAARSGRGGSHRARRRRDARLRSVGEVALRRRPALDQPGVIGALSGRMAVSRRRSASSASRALLDDQELDSRASTGAIYWEGLSQLADAAGRARRPRLPRDDRLRRAPRRSDEPMSPRRRPQCAPAASTATFFAGLSRPDEDEQRDEEDARQEEQVVRPRACRPAGRSCG